MAFGTFLTRVQCCTAAYAGCGFGIGFDIIGGFVVVGCFHGLALGFAAPTQQRNVTLALP